MDKELFLENNDGMEMGRLFIQFKLRTIELEQKIDDDQYELEKIYFDPFETDQSIIQKKIKFIEQSLGSKQKELKLSLQQLNEVKVAQKAGAFELAKVKITKAEVDEANNKLRGEINSLDELSELHIQIDILKQSPQGVNMLKEKLSVLLNRLELEREYGSKLLNNFVKIDGFIQKQKEINTQIKEVKEATKEIDFNIKRCDDQIPIFNGLKETVKSHERIIENLENQVQNQLSLYDKVSSKDSEIILEKLKYDHDLLIQKHTQLETLINMNHGILPLENYNEYKDDPYIQESAQEIKKKKEEATYLMSEIEKISREFGLSNKLD